MVGAEKLFQLKKNPRLNSFLVRFFSLVPELFMKKLSKIMLVLLAMSLATTKSDLPLLLYFIQALLHLFAFGQFTKNMFFLKIIVFLRMFWTSFTVTAPTNTRLA